MGFSDIDEELVLGLAVAAALAIENARLVEEASELALEADPERIGMDLHDTGGAAPIRDRDRPPHSPLGRLRDDVGAAEPDDDDMIELRRLLTGLHAIPHP